MTITILEGDCLAILPTLPAESVDAVVTDPPYGLEFMGKEWDRPWARGDGAGGTSDGFSAVVMPDGANRLPRPSYMSSTNPTCRICSGDRRGSEERERKGRKVCHCAAPEFPNVAAIRGRAFQAWCESWARETYRVLKPGGHLVAFGGTRTFHRLACAIEDAGFEIRDCLSWLYGSGFPKSLDVSKAIDKAAGAQRPVVGYDASRARPNRKYEAGAIGNIGGTGHVSDRSDNGATLTSAATDAARQWDGWGTALKPAWESVILARKPRSESDRIGSCLLRLYASIAALSSASNPSVSGAAGSAGAPSAVAGPPNTSAGSSALTDTSPSESVTTTSLSIVSSWLNTWAEHCSLMSTSTTATTSSPTTDWTTLWSCLSRITPEAIIEAATRGRGAMPLVDGAEALFGAVSSNSAVTRSLSALGSAIDEAPISPLAEDEAPLSPLWEPIILARKPLSERSVAANVLLHGTGGVNVDACRIEGDMTSAHYGGNQRSSIGYGGTEAGRGYATQGASGRWPANVILDEEAARLLDEQSGELHSQRPETRLSRSRVIGVTDMGTGRSVEYAGTGGASRFFYTAKADSAERTDGMAQRSKHPTVKPLAIMVWLVKLVTPPGGVVLDPFLGSGTTAIACVGNGFSCIGIEREAEYVEEARQRVGLGVEVVTWSGMPAT